MISNVALSVLQGDVEYEHDVVITEQYPRERQQHPEIIFPEGNVISSVLLSVLQGGEVVHEQLHQDFQQGAPAAEVVMRDV